VIEVDQQHRDDPVVALLLSGLDHLDRRVRNRTRFGRSVRGVVER
jgi:hypothetical protein